MRHRPTYCLYPKPQTDVGLYGPILRSMPMSDALIKQISGVSSVRVFLQTPVFSQVPNMSSWMQRTDNIFCSIPTA